jgi:hypothetical protein
MKDQVPQIQPLQRLHPLPSSAWMGSDPRQHYHSPVAPPDRRRQMAAGTRVQRMRGRSH